MDHDLLTAAEVADLFRVTESTVGQWRRDGKIQAVPLPGGKGFRFRSADVDALLAPTTEAAS